MTTVRLKVLCSCGECTVMLNPLCKVMYHVSCMKKKFIHPTMGKFRTKFNYLESF